MEERRVEQDEVEALAADRLEEVTHTGLDAPLEVVDQGVQVGAARGLRVDVRGDHAGAEPRGENRHQPRARAEVEHAGAGRTGVRVDHLREKDARSQPRPVEHTRKDDDPNPIRRSHAKLLVVSKRDRSPQAPQPPIQPAPDVVRPLMDAVDETPRDRAYRCSIGPHNQDPCNLAGLRPR